MTSTSSQFVHFQRMRVVAIWWSIRIYPDACPTARRGDRIKAATIAKKADEEGVEPGRNLVRIRWLLWPLKNTVEFPASRFVPFRVIVKACPFTGGLGLVVMLLITGAVAPADTVSDTPPEVSPVVLFRNVTVNVPVARIA